MFYYGFDDSSQYLLYLLAVLIVVYAQSRLNGAYQKYRSIASSSMLSGEQCAQRILSQSQLSHVRVEVSDGGILSDHYDPRHKVVRLSSEIFYGSSIASLSVAAHECGHVLQDAHGFVFLRIRDALVPVVNLASRIGWILLVFGLLLFYRSSTLLIIGAALLGVSLLFQIVTLPVELDASRRALVILRESAMLEEAEIPMARAMLRAAAFTYVASVLSTLTQLLRILLLARGRDCR